MSRAMQKRIGRARAEGERIARQRFADQQAEDQRTIADLNKRLHGIEVQGKVSAAEQKHDQEMRELETALEKAHTDGNHTEIARVTRAMQEKATAWENKKRELLNAPVQEPQRKRPQQKGPTPEGQAWVAANAEWYDKPGFEAETNEAVRLDQELMASGSDPNSPEHYESIQRSLRRKFRRLDVRSPDDEDDDRRDDRDDDQDDRRAPRDRDDDEDDDDRDDGDRGEEDEDEDDEEDRDVNDRQRRRPPSMNFEDAGARRSNGVKMRGGKIVLSAGDRENMERFGLDPTNDKHVEQWARTKRENAEQED